MDGKFQMPDLKDPFLGKPSFHYLPKAASKLSSAHLPMALDARNPLPLQDLLKSLGPGEMLRVSRGVDEVVNGKRDSGMAGRENGGEAVTGGADGGRTRRPDVGRKRTAFSLLPEVSQPAPQVDSKTILDRIKDPHEYFEAYDRLELAEKEMKRLKGDSELVPNENQQLITARFRRPGLDIGRKSTYTHLYPKFAKNAEKVLPYQEKPVLPVASLLSPKLAVKDVDISRERAAEDASNLMREANNNPRISKDGAAFADGRAENMLDELLVSSGDLDDDQALHMLQDRLNIKPLDLEKLNIPDLDNVPKIDFHGISISTSKSTDGLGNTWTMLLKDRQSGKGKQILSTPPRIDKEAVLLSSNSDKNDASSLRRNIDSILLARNENRLTFSDKSQASHARVTKETSSPLADRMKFGLRSFSPNNYPNSVNFGKDFATVEMDASKHVDSGNVIDKRYSKLGAAEDSSGLVDISLNMDGEQTDVGNTDVHDSRMQNNMDVKHKKESVTHELRLGLGSHREGTVSLTGSQMDDSFSLGDINMGTNSEKAYEGKVIDGSLEEKDNDKVPEESVCLEPTASRKGHPAGTTDGSLDLSQQQTTLDMNLAPEGNLESSNVTVQNVKEQTRVASVRNSKLKGRPPRKNKKEPQPKKRTCAVKLATTLDTSPNVEENLESSNVWREQEPARFESEMPVKAKAHAQRQRNTVPKRHSLAGAGSSWQAGLRRSTRIKIEPTKWWKGERLLYGRVHDSLATVIGVKLLKNDADKNNREYGVESFVSDNYSDLVKLAAGH